jgi:hypothetical protein
MGQSKLTHCHTPIFLDVSSDIGDRRRFPNLPPVIQLPLISGQFPLKVLDDGINLCLLQAIVAICRRHCFLFVFEAFTGSGESINKVT